MVLSTLAMIVLPIPPFLLDLSFTFNIALAMVVLLVTVYTRCPLDFAAFPTVLLIATLLRLALNVASTRAKRGGCDVSPRGVGNRDARRR